MKVKGRKGTAVEVFYDTEEYTVDVHVLDTSGEWAIATVSLGRAKQLMKAMGTCVARVEEAKCPTR